MAFVLAVWAEDGIEVEQAVPSSWVINNYVYWPKCSNAERKIKKREQPHDNWLKFPLIKLKYRNDNLMTCRGHCETSAMESDEEEVAEVRYRKKPKRDDFISDYSSGSEVTARKLFLKPPTTVRSNSNSTPTPYAHQTPQVFTPASNYTLIAQTPVHKDVTPSAQVEESPLFVMEQEDNVIYLDNTDNQIDVMAALSRIEGKFDTAMKDLNKKPNVVCNEVLKLQEIAREKTSGNDVSQNDLSQFTIAEEVCSFTTEEPLKLQRKLGQLGGATPRNCVSNILNSLMTSEVQTQLSVYGRGPMKKLPIKNTALYQIIIDAVVSKYPDTDRAAACHMIMEHLKQAKNRLLKEKNRENILIVQTASR